MLGIRFRGEEGEEVIQGVSWVEDVVVDLMNSERYVGRNKRFSNIRAICL